MFDFRLDCLFKFTVMHPMLLKTLIHGVTHLNIGDLTIHNPDVLRTKPNEKGVHYDIQVFDDLSHRFDVEMQNSRINKALIKRFGYYGSKLVNENIHIGEDYDLLGYNSQIILVNDKNTDRLVKAYIPRVPSGKHEGKNVNMNEDESLLVRYYVYLPYINVIAKEKDIENLNDFETMIYILYNGINKHMLNSKRKVVEIMKDRLRDFNMNEELRSLAFDRKVYLSTEKQEKEEFYQNGQKELILDLLEGKYPDQDLSWINKCNKEQLLRIRQVLKQNRPMNYQDFYHVVFSHN